MLERERRQKTIHVEGLPQLTLTLRAKCGVVETPPELVKHFPHLPPKWEGCDCSVWVIGVPDWESMGMLIFMYSEKHKMGLLENIFVWPVFRGKGIAREMNRFATEYMRKKRVEKIYTSILEEEWIPRMEAAGFRLVPSTERLYVKELSNLGGPEVAGSNPAGAEPLIPYWAIPAAFTLILVGAAFAGWVASQLEGEA